MHYSLLITEVSLTTKAEAKFPEASVYLCRNTWHKGAQKGRSLSQYEVQLLQKNGKDQQRDLQGSVVHMLIYYIVF